MNRRPLRPPDYETENRALVALAQALAESPRTILQKMAELMLETFRADSAGFSLLTKEDGGKRFYWPAIAGVWKPHIGGGTPRDFGPCGDVLDRNRTLLFTHPERRYPYLVPISPAIVECLLVPFYVEGKAVGTIWAIAHDERRKFDAEDMRQLVSLSRFASAAYQAVESLNILSEREERFRRLVDLLPVAIYTCEAPSGVITFYNEHAAKLWGRAPVIGDTDEVFCGSHSLFLPNGTPVPHEECPMAIALREGRSFRSPEMIIERPDGTRISAIVNIDPIRDSRGSVVGAINGFIDTTALKQAENAVRVSEERFRSLMEATTSVVWTTDAEGRFVTPQPSWSEFTGQTWEQLRDFGWANALHPDDRQRMRSSWAAARAARTRTLYESDGRLWHAATGSYRHFEARGVAILNADGSVREWVGECLDVEDRKRAEEASREADRRKDEFLATLSHELRTPLTAMLGWVRLLRSGTLDASTAQRALEVVERNVNHQSRLITDLLDISRIISGKLALEKAVIDFDAVVAGVVDTMRPAAAAKAIALTAELAAGAHVHGDAERLRQVVANLLSNAVKFTPTGGLVTVRLVRVADRTTLTVTDTGKGISAEFLPHIFGFRQADSGSTRAHAGLGIGLAIVRHLVELHEGSVHAESLGQGKGATFTVDLPLTDPATGNADALDASVIPVSRLNTLGGIRVLIVDDDTDSRDLFTAILSQQGAEVTAVETVHEALAALWLARPDVVLCDLAMPGDDGFALIRKLRSWPNDQGGAVPAVALTAYARLEDRERAIAAGFYMHLSKPVEPPALIEAVARLAHRGR